MKIKMGTKNWNKELELVPFMGRTNEQEGAGEGNELVEGTKETKEMGQGPMFWGENLQDSNWLWREHPLSMQLQLGP